MPGDGGRSAAPHAALVLAGYTTLALWITRPLGAHLTDHSLVANRFTSFDIPLNAWILSWGSHALATHPGRLFDANVYHPVPDALAYTEHMLGSLPFFAPGFLLTGNPALALNLMILAGLVLSAAATYWVTWRWTGSRAAATFAGLVFGFYPDHVRALGPNLQTIQYLPIVLLCLDRVLERPRPAAVAGLTLAVLGQSLASYYYAYPTLLATLAATLVVTAIPRLRPSPASLASVALALGLTALVMAVVSRPYFRVAAGGRDTIYAMAQIFESAPSRVLGLLAWAPVRLGWPPVVLAIVGALWALWPTRPPATRRRALVLGAFVVTGYLLLAGPTLRVGAWSVPMPARVLDEWAPGFEALRDRKRFFVLVALAVAVLGGMGIRGLVTVWGAGRQRALASAALMAAVIAATGLAVDLGPCRLTALPTGSQVPPVYRALAAHERAPVLEVPVGTTVKDWPAVHANTWYEYFSIFHWRPLLNGYASYWPRELEMVMGMARGLPAPRALENLVACTELGWVVVHTDRLPRRDRQRWEPPVPGLALAGRFASDLLFRVTAAANPAACPTGLLAAHPATTLEGTPLSLVPDSDRRVVLEALDLPSTLVRPRPPVALAAHVRLRNDGTAVWPALAVPDGSLVHLTYRWFDALGRRVPERWRLTTRLPVDVRPGETIEVPLALRLPPWPGRYRFEVVVRQGLQGYFRTTGPGADPRTVTVQ